jgi:hypothetical protein
METIHIEIKNEKALGLLHELEVLKWIEILDEQKPGKPFADKYWGILNEEESASLNKHLEEIRNEW